MWTYFTPYSRAFIVNFEHVISSWNCRTENMADQTYLEKLLDIGSVIIMQETSVSSSFYKQLFCRSSRHQEYLIKTLAKSLKYSCNKCGGHLLPANYFVRNFISYDFFYTLETPIFMNTSERLSFMFFPWMQCVEQKFTFLIFHKNIGHPVLVSYKLDLGICLIIPDVSTKTSPAFQNTEAVF